MTDDIWRNEDGGDPSTGSRRPGRFEAQMDDFDSEEFGGPLFGDDSEPTRTPTGENAGLDLSDDSTGPLPHWTEPPTGEVPRIESASTDTDDGDDLDVWSTFTSESPVWKEGDSVDAPTGSLGTTDVDAPEEPSPAFASSSPTGSSGRTPRVGGPDAPADPTGELRWEDDPSGGSALDPLGADPSGSDAVTTSTEVVGSDVPRDPPRITIGTDPSGMPRRPDPARRGSTPQRPPSSSLNPTDSDGRDLPVAVASGLALAAAFLALTIFVGPLGSLLFVVAVLAISGVEYFGKVTEKGYRPAVAPGVIAIAASTLAAYWVGPEGMVITIAFAFLVGALGFIAAPSIEAGPMPNMAITTLGIVWIGLLGSYAGLILDFSNGGGPDGRPWGTDTMVLLAIGVVANDVGAYFVGSAFGRTPLRSWISPAKSVEGFLGGTVLTLIVMVIIGLQDWSDTWSNMGHLLMLGIVISLLAPLGDLIESMFKRNLGIKDFGTVIAGHGGVLDRFDGVLVALPGVYYLFVVLEPWTARV
ncbi:phosphatidate cytidylyltransferase [Ilumatobacter sp.]|uniref:phosphatidate cytidylyltransferase n=1 Tax=Ilumatobacter sp. TaxID=1967498 RepID=UPI003B52560D